MRIFSFFFFIHISNSAKNTKLQIHFPNRAPKRISEKWARNLNPKFDAETPFSKEEDELLLKSVEDLIAKKKDEEKSTSSWTFSEIQHLFPIRKVTSLFQRWLKIASEDSLVEKYSCTVKQKGGARKGLVGSSADGALFSPDDFVVRMKKE